jgi:hypothetical protein
MTPIELRQKLHHQLDQLPQADLSLVDHFLASLEFRLESVGTESTIDASIRSITDAPTEFHDFLANLKHQPLRRAAPIRLQATGQDLLQVAGTWQGDDMEECRQILQASRSQAEF